MATFTVPGADAPAATPGGSEDALGADRAFERWALTAYLLVVAGLVVVIGFWLGRFVYVLDDPAIHLAVSGNLAENGTWGVVPGHFESASSSPLWTMTLAAVLAVTPAAVAHWLPLALNVAAGAVVLVILGRDQTLLRPSRSRVDAAVTVALAVVVLFLPGLAVVGMEHTLHVALVLAAVVAFYRTTWRAGSGAATSHWPWWSPYALLALATLARFETAFVGAGLIVALVVAAAAEPAAEPGGRWVRVRARVRAQWRPVVGVVASVAVPIVAFGLVNLALGGGILPNPILAKGQGTNAPNAAASGIGPSDVIHRFLHDPLLVTLVVVAVIYLVLTWRRAGSAPDGPDGPDGPEVGGPGRWSGAWALPAIALLVATALHALLAAVGWYDRYQAYLIAFGLWVVLGIVSEVPAAAKRRAVVALALVAVMCAAPKLTLLGLVPRAADDMHRHQYQAGRFLDTYYEGQSVATDQLGYISWYHDGPVTDFAGLGDYEALNLRPAESDRDATGLYWDELARERDVQVVVLYDSVSVFSAPDHWIRAGSLEIDGDAWTSVSEGLVFWAADPAAAEPLVENLRDFEPDLPDRVSLELNELAAFQAEELLLPEAP